jgi:hypothetical protein
MEMTDPVQLLSAGKESKLNDLEMMKDADSHDESEDAFRNSSLI